LAVERFEDLVAWQRARVLAREVYVLTRTGDFARDFGLRDQIQRSAVSVMANVAEGFDRNRPLEFARFLDIAKGSCAEVKSHLYIAHDVGYVSQPNLVRVLGLADETAKVIAGLRRTTGDRALGTGDSRREASG
jgi:four helix bundle protein